MSRIVIPLNSYSQSTISKEDYESYFREIKDAGAYGVELREELLDPQLTRLNWLKEKLEETKLFTVYSSPAHLWNKQGVFNQQEIENVFSRAKQIGASWVKVSLGHYISGSYAFTGVIKFLEENQGIQLLVENDQTVYGGQIEPLQAFFSEVNRQSIDIKMTFDSGNWLYTRQDPMEALEIFAPYVMYLHLKKVITLNNKRVTVPISIEPSGWRPFIEAFPKEMVKALEFPIHPLEITKEYVDLVQESERDYLWNK